MKTIIVLAISLAVACAFEYQEEWEAWKTTYKKTYKSEMEELKRQIIWESNRVFVKNHNENADKFKFTVAMNEFADLDTAEFAAIYNGYRSDLKRNSSVLYRASGKQLAASIDWREKGAVTAVKNQGHCGSCWSFSATGSLEGQHFLKKGQLVSLSEQQLCDCSRSFGNKGCKGGLMDNAFRYLATVAGDESEEDYPYRAEDETICKYEARLAVAGTKSHVDIPRGSIADLKDAVSEIGPISVAMDAGHKSFQLYHSGVYSEAECSSTKLDHGVLVVGYGGSEGIFGEKYWLVKNSWGPGWGMEGFFKIAQEDNMCGICTQASYPTTVS